MEKQNKASDEKSTNSQFKLQKGPNLRGDRSKLYFDYHRFGRRN
jgi:hypothetical protein